jgi:tetratricopeptide (TPR) repeat protein
MELDQWTSLEPSVFKQQLLEERYTDDNISLIDLYNALIRKAEGEPARIAKIAEAVIEAFDFQGATSKVLLFLELLARIHVGRGDPDAAMTVIERIIALDNESAETIALELAQLIVECADEFGISLDQRPRALSLAGTVFRHYGKLEKIADMYIQSALIYSHHGASQAAYRCIRDAETISHELQSSPLLARCYSTSTAVACEEPDFKWAIGFGKKALAIYQEARLKPPAGLLSNLGMAYMNLGKLKPATRYFEKALTHNEAPALLKFAVQLNLTNCLRRRNRLPQAEAMLAMAMAGAEIKDHPEYSLELALTAAKLAKVKSDFPMLSSQLRVASQNLDKLLEGALRLHHRRGLRERYIVRFERLLHSLPESGSATDALLSIVSTRGNAMGDWLVILSWAANIKQAPNFTSALADQLNNIINRIRDLGAPHLFGMREKYDDAWELHNSANVWDDLSQFCARIKALGLPSIYDQATSQYQTGLCQTRLAQGHCLMVTTYANHEAFTWYFIGDRYQRVSIPVKIMDQWLLAQLEYAEGSKSREFFMEAMSNLIQQLFPILDTVFIDIANAECASIRYIEDSLFDLPLTLFALRNANLAARMKSGDFQTRRVPALVEQLEDSSPLSATVAIIDHREDLLLAPYEAHAFTRAAGLDSPTCLSAGSDGDLESLICDQNVVIVSTHGHTLQFLTDAYFGQLGDPAQSHLIHVSSLQKSAPNFCAQLAILNTCYSGSKSSRNYQQTFRTSDSVSIPNLFLLNRRAVALAGAWKISDTASFIMAHLIGEGLQCGLEPSMAVASAIAKLPNMTRSATVAILTDNLPDLAQAKAIPRLDFAPEEGMFSDPYFTAGLGIHGLL